MEAKALGTIFGVGCMVLLGCNPVMAAVTAGIVIYTLCDVK